MASLREIRRKIKSVKSTQQITKAMKMVAAARMRRAQTAILASRPFAVHMESAVRDLAALSAEFEKAAGREAHIHPFFETREGGRPCLIIVTGDKGLCGAFNANAIRAALEWVRRNKDKKPAVAIVGRKAREVMHRLKDVQLDVIVELVGIFPKVTFAHAELVGKAVTEAFLEKGCASVDMIYNEFKSVVAQRVVTTRLLPVPVPEATEGGTVNAQGFKFEPGRDALLAALMPRYLKAQLYRVLLESQAAELAARMNAMDSASKNAGELIGSLTLSLNRTRQGIITREIAEIVGGAEALAS
jgi:F-type H+-transporting ATPase subunit gamma